MVQEQGFNGLHLNQVANSWVRGVTISNSDMGVYLWGAVFTTLDGVLLTNSKPRGWFNGHRGIWIEHGSDCLITNFNITDRFVHDLSVSATEHGTVFMNGQGYDINLDHHRMTPYQVGLGVCAEHERLVAKQAGAGDDGHPMWAVAWPSWCLSAAPLGCHTQVNAQHQSCGALPA